MTAPTEQSLQIPPGLICCTTKREYRRPAMRRLAINVTVLPSGCWQWTGSLRRDGYARLCGDEGSRAIYAHRLSYERFIGPVPEDRELDHLCRNRGCVNPEHLEVVDRATNMARSVARCSKLTHCKRGHEFTPS